MAPGIHLTRITSVWQHSDLVFNKEMKMKRAFFVVLIGLLFTGCAGITHYYNRDGWSYSVTQEQFKNRLVISPKEAVLEKVEPKIPSGAKVVGVASVKVLIDPDGTLIAAAIDREIQNASWLNKHLITAARKTKFAKKKDRLDRPTHYISIIVYGFR